MNFWAWHNGMFELHSGCGVKERESLIHRFCGMASGSRGSDFRKDVAGVVGKAGGEVAAPVLGGLT